MLLHQPDQFVELLHLRVVVFLLLCDALETFCGDHFRLHAAELGCRRRRCPLFLGIDLLVPPVGDLS
jgi:hypothetical protein